MDKKDLPIRQVRKKRGCGEMKDFLERIVVNDVHNVVMIRSAGGQNNEVRHRATWGLSFCLEGKITYIHKGREYVSDREHAILLPQGETYTVRRDESGRFPLINFTCDTPLCSTHTLIPVHDLPSYVRDFEQMRELSVSGENRLQVMSLFYRILHRLAARQVPAVLLPAIRYVEEHYSDPTLGNTELAMACKISEVYLRKLFERHLQTSPKQYVIDLRITRAKQLLSEGSLKIAAVSEQCGFSNPYHFCRTFKKQTGQTPTSYQRSNETALL